jgi:hypothetical protein
MLGALHGTTRSICARNSRLRVRLIARFSPRSACFIGGRRCRSQASACKLRAGRRLVQTFLSHHNRFPVALVAPSVPAV